jgi:hypothetical protein
MEYVITSCRHVQGCNQDAGAPNGSPDLDGCITSGCAAAIDGVDDPATAECVNATEDIRNGTEPCLRL